MPILFSTDRQPLPLPEGHRFPAEKYPRLRQAVLAAPWFDSANLRESSPATVDQLLTVHTEEYVADVLNGTLTERALRRIGLPWSPALVERSLASVGATIAACRAALHSGCGASLGGGTHHAYADHGQGYCVFNDVAVAIRVLQREGLIRQAGILDCDVHQGNGTAHIFTGDPTVFTFSIHGEKNFPFHKEQSSLDVALPDGATDQLYQDALAASLDKVFDRPRPGLVIYLAGADPYYDDTLGRLALTKAGLASRDRLVFETVRTHRVPLAIVMSGGYARDIADTVAIQLETLRLASEIFSPPAATSAGIERISS